MKPFQLLLLVSFIHPGISATLASVGVLDALIGVKGAPVGFIYDVLSAIFLILNAPGILLMLPWAETSFFHVAGWKPASSGTVIFLSWLSWTSIGGFLLKAFLLRHAICASNENSENGIS